MSTRVLVTGVGGPAGRSLATQLLGREVAVVGADMQPARVAGALTATVPPASDPRFVAVLRGLVAEHAITMVVPTVSEELPHIAAAAGTLGPKVHVVVGTPAAVGLADDKFRTAQRLSECGVGVPRFALAEELDDADAALALLGSPAIVKPRVSRGGRGVVLLEPGTEVDWELLAGTHIVQEFAPGTEYAPVAHRSRDGETFVRVLEKTVLTCGRVGNALEIRRVPVAEAADVADVARAAVDALGLTGPVDLDVRRRADGVPVVLEVNARFGANSAAVPELVERVLAAGRAERLART